MTLSSDGKALTGLWFDFQKYDRATLERNYHEEELAVFDETKEWLRQYFRGENPSFFPKLKPKVTGFRKEVLEALLEIPYGKTKTYGEIAKQIARKRGVESISPQAVGNAIAHTSDWKRWLFDWICGGRGAENGSFGVRKRSQKLGGRSFVWWVLFPKYKVLVSLKKGL